MNMLKTAMSHQAPVPNSPGLPKGNSAPAHRAYGRNPKFQNHALPYLYNPSHLYLA